MVAIVVFGPKLHALGGSSGYGDEIASVGLVGMIILALVVLSYLGRKKKGKR